MGARMLKVVHEKLRSVIILQELQAARRCLCVGGKVGRRRGNLKGVGVGEDQEGRGAMADDTSKSDRMFRLRFHVFSAVKREVAGHQGDSVNGVRRICCPVGFSAVRSLPGSHRICGVRRTTLLNFLNHEKAHIYYFNNLKYNENPIPSKNISYKINKPNF